MARGQPPPFQWRTSKPRRWTEAWRTVLDDLVRRGLRRPELLIVDGGAGLESAIAAVWDSATARPVRRRSHQ
jgi:putative transposase